MFKYYINLYKEVISIIRQRDDFTNIEINDFQILMILMVKYNSLSNELILIIIYHCVYFQNIT